MRRLFHWSDLHFGAELPAAVDALVRITDRLEPDGILIGGDFTMRARRHEWKAARSFLDRLDYPWIAIPGNHDIPAFNHPWHRIFDPFDRYEKTISEELEPRTVLGGVEVVGLNTARRWGGGGGTVNWSHGAVSVAQCVGLPLRFEAGTDLRAVMVHHPLIAPPGQKRRLLRRDGLLLAALEKSHVDLLLAGHFHQSHIGLLKLPLGTRDVVLSHVSTACSLRTKGEPPGFHGIELDEGRIEIVRYDFGKDEFTEIARECFVRAGDGGWKRP